MARNITVIPASRTMTSGIQSSIPQKLKVAAYCRVSTDNEEQLSSYENQVRYYTDYINLNPNYEFAGIFADEGISGVSTAKRTEFNRMIDSCRQGNINRIITKSISRFARNTLDCLNYVRELKAIGVGITFEKENIDTLDSKGEVLLTILSSLSQDESRSISENSQWGIRKRFENGEHKMSTKRFLGYDTDENGKLVINKPQAEIVKKIYSEYLAGKTCEQIKREFEKNKIKNWDGRSKWQTTTIAGILKNEKYKGDVIAWNEICQNRNSYMLIWNEHIKSGSELEVYIAKKFMEYSMEKITDVTSDFVLKTLNHIEIMENGSIVVNFLDGTVVEIKTE